MYSNIPDELKQFNQWIVWRLEDKDAPKPTKVPYDPMHRRMAAVNNPETWSSFENALNTLKIAEGFFDGIGFVLTEDDPFTFIDLDDPYAIDHETGKTKFENPAEIYARQHKIYTEFNSYAELSPSGRGLHIIVKGAVPSGRKRGSIEVYSNLRYMTMTGNVYRAKLVEDFDLLANVLWEQMGGSAAKSFYDPNQPQNHSDDEIIAMAVNASNGEKFKTLLDGNWHSVYPSQSEADLAFVNIIAFYTQNREQITRIFKSSQLGSRNKQTSIRGVDYVNYMINKSFDRMLPPVDIEGLTNKLNEMIEAKAKASKDDREAALKAEIAKAPKQPKSNPYTVPDGLIGEIARFIYSAAPRPVPEIALAGALGLMAGIVGRAYNVSGTGLNQYVLLLAQTGTGKEAIARGIDKLMSNVLRAVPSSVDFIGPGEIASGQAIIKYMAKGPVSFTSVVGEFGSFLSEMGKPNCPPHLVSLKRFLLDAFNKSGEGQTLKPSIYSDRDKNTTTILSPAFSMIGETAPEPFYEGLHEGMISNGLLPRFTVIEYLGKRPELNNNHLQAQPSFELIEKLSTICAHALMLNSQNKTINVVLTEDAQNIFNQFNDHCDGNINNSEREIKRHLWNRAHIKALKLAGLVAVGINPYNPTIDKTAAEWALGIVVADVRNMLERFDAGEVGIDNEETKQLAAVTAAIKSYVTQPWHDAQKYAGEGMSHLHSARIIPYGYIQRKLAAVAVFRKDRIGSTGALKRAIKTLCERGDIAEIAKPELMKNYKVSSLCYMINNGKSFGF